MRMHLTKTRKADVLCNRHLVGDWGELFKHRHNFIAGHSIKGRVGQIEPLAMQEWADELKRVADSRGLRFKAVYVAPGLGKYGAEDREMKVDYKNSVCKMVRCDGCRRLIMQSVMKEEVSV